MKAQVSRRDSGSKQEDLANRISKEVLDCDPSILSLLVVNSLGKVLAVGRSKRLSKSNYLEEDIMPKLGVLAKMIMGAADTESGLLGRMEYLIGAFKDHKIVLIDVPELDLSLALRMSRSSEAEYVCNKVAEILKKFD